MNTTIIAHSIGHMISYRNRQSLFPPLVAYSLSSQLPYKTVVLSYFYDIAYWLIVLRYPLEYFVRLDLFTLVVLS